MVCVWKCRQTPGICCFFVFVRGGSCFAVSVVTVQFER